MLTLALLVLFTLTKGMNLMQKVFSSDRQMTVLIDPGHGGFDPGKVGVNDKLEKEINLAIALKLKTFLEQNDVKVILTREADVGLYAETDSNKKRVDLRNRVNLVEQVKPDLMLSIHQNSFPSGSETGAQVFYYGTSEESQKLATLLQEQMKKTLDPNNRRSAKSNNSYFIIKNTSCPAVIIECGFLSNYEECNKLSDENYQEKVAYSIHLGTLQYLNTASKK